MTAANAYLQLLDPDDALGFATNAFDGTVFARADGDGGFRGELSIWP
jgi:hypothetical protein